MTRRAKTDTWYPFFIGDYRKDTARLSCEQHGAYRQLMDEYWVTGPLPDDDQILARLVGLDLRAWRKHRPVLAKFFSVAAGEWRHGRIDRELVDAAERKTKAEAKAKAAAEARWGRSDRASPKDAPGMLQALHEDVHEECPPPSPIEEGDANASPVGSASPAPTGSAGKKQPWERDAAFGQFWDAATPKMRARAKSKAKVWPGWREARKWVSANDLVAALKAYLRSDPDVERTGGPGLHLWLRDKTYESWMSSGVQPSTQAPAWDGPADVLEAVVRGFADAVMAGSYLRSFEVRESGGQRVMISPNGFAVDTMRRRCGPLLEGIGVQVRLEKVA